MDNKIFNKIIYDSIIKLSDDIIDRLNIIQALNTNMDEFSVVKDIIPSKSNFYCSIQKYKINDLVIIFDNNDKDNDNYIIIPLAFEYSVIIDNIGNKYFSDINGIHKYIDVATNTLYIDKNNILTSKYNNKEFLNYEFNVNLSSVVNLNNFYKNSSTLKFFKEIKNFIEIATKKGIAVLGNQKILFYKPDINKLSSINKILIMFVDLSSFFDVNKNNITIKNFWENSDVFFNTITYLDEISKIISQFENLKNILIQYKNIHC